METLTRPIEPTILLPQNRRLVLADGPQLAWQRELRRHLKADRGAVTVSGTFILPFKRLYDGTDMVIDWVNDAIKYALFTNTITPNFSTDTAYGSAPYNANEVSGTGYTAGGVALASKTVTESPTGTLMFDANDPSWTTATFSSARCGLAWDDTITTPTGDPVLALQNFAADFGVTAGTLTVQLNVLGLFTDDRTP